MKGFLRATFASVTVFFSAASFGQFTPQSTVVAEYATDEVSVIDAQGYINKYSELVYPGASFVKVHFNDFRPPPGLIVEVRNPAGTESYVYSRDYKDSRTFDLEQGDDGERSFYSMSISGDTAVIEIHGHPGYIKSGGKAFKGRVFVDHIVRGLELEKAMPSISSARKAKGVSSLASIGSVDFSTESTCGALERYDAVCWAGSDPEAYDRSQPVARLVTRTSGCTAWRVGPDNHLFTNNHCIADQAATSASEVWFNYEKSVCGGEGTETIVKVPADQMIATDYTLDFTLFSVADFAAIEWFGNLGLEVREAVLGETIYIPQHGSGDPKQISIDSDMNASGLCQVDDETLYGRDFDTDIGYYCDTTGGSSGSPVILAESQKAIALHHQGNCLNSGVKMSEIWRKVKRHFGQTVPEGDFDPDNLRTPSKPAPDPDPEPDPDPDSAPVASIGFTCSFLDCEFDGSGSSDAEGPINAFHWNFGDESQAEGVSIQHSFALSGSYSVTLTVIDSAGNTDTANRTVTVADQPVVNQLPNAEFSFSCTDLTCTFDASGSSDPDGSIAAYGWEFGDGQGNAGKTVTHAFASGGVYPVTLMVTDDQGASSSVSLDITVTQPVPPPSDIVLTATGEKVRGKKWADLTWIGTDDVQVQILRDGIELAVVKNTGTYRDSTVDNPTKAATYQVCNANGENCSNKLEVNF